MAGFTDTLENEVLDHVFSRATYTAPATLYVGLSTTTPTDAGTNFTEPVGNGYARVAVTNDATNFPAAVGGAKSNGTVITFPQATPSGWGTITHAGLFDAASNGNLLAFGALTASLAVNANNTPRIPVGDLDFTLD